jgi:hypothetical protein
MDDGSVEFRFEAEVIHWRGPAPYFYAPVPADQVDRLKAVARAASYGWGVVPVAAQIGETGFNTSLFPKGGTYLLPLKDAVRHAIDVTAGDTVAVVMTVRPRPI